MARLSAWSRPLLALAVLGLLAPSGSLAGGASHSVSVSGAAVRLTTDQVALPSGTPTAPLAPTTSLTLVFTLASSDPAGLAAVDRAVGDPSSTSYRGFLTFPQVVGRFGPSPTEITGVEQILANAGASDFARTPDGFGLSARITAASAEALLSTPFVRVSTPQGSELGYTAVGPPHVPSKLVPWVRGIGGLSDLANGHLSLALAPLTAPARWKGPGSFVVDGSSGLNEPWFFGSDFASAYRTTGLYPPSTSVPNATYPSGEAIATLLMSGYNVTFNADLPPFDPAVVEGYFNATFGPGWPMPVVGGQPVTVNGVTPPTPGAYNVSQDSTDNSVENSLDLEMAGSLAPGARLENFYFAGSLLEAPSANPSNGDLADDFAQTLAAALSFNYSPARLAAVSGSFGLPDLNDSLWNTELSVAQAMGVTVVAASGDQGNAPPVASGRFQGQWPTWPGTAAFNATGTLALGGLTPTLSGTPTSTFNGTELNATFDPTVTGVASAAAWYDTFPGFGNLSGTEGGASPVIGEPYWQAHSAAQPAIVNATVQQGAATLGRSEPDLALPANETVAFTLENSSGLYFQVLEGTSVAAPLFAGMVAAIAAVEGHPLGYLDPELYRIASYYAAQPSAPGDPFQDVTQGGNYYFSAAGGWDATTGWGGVDAVALLLADENATVAGYTYTGAVPGLPPPLSSPITYGTPSLWLFAVIGIAVTIAVILVISVGRSKPPGTPVPPYGAWSGAPPAGYGEPAPPPPGPGPLPSRPPHTFLCPYCGAPRPAEPTRCPNCGRL